MELEAGSLIASLVVSSVGLVAVLYGKRQQRVPHVVAGLALIGFPYFVPGVVLMASIAAVLLLGLWLVVRLGL
jgi:hypothetical protein